MPGIDPQFAYAVEELGIAEVAKFDTVNANLNARLGLSVLGFSPTKVPKPPRELIKPKA